MLHVKTFWPAFPIYWELMTSLRLFTLTFPAQFSVKIQPMLMLMKLLTAKVAIESLDWPYFSVMRSESFIIQVRFSNFILNIKHLLSRSI